ncbi:beta-L-arabinofuranosidase domain-containing protein [Pengzhenrongella sicca]|uniref:Glycoside hydrolase family 127 protein n=1 Tax=Pengzhenrongella sicca TaxID=2819238 RepID=A0A8A4ZHU3_9MICO|nr:beta-L-arabinofuranosidase domain-containing protein [Pengzhenrongella sicca]QTE30961.1 glycoside hydrolase family 127 protein [Pengzhenrongella sicca]
MSHAKVRLAPGVFDTRRRLNRAYLESLRAPALLQNHLTEAGIGDQAWHLHPSAGGAADRGLDRHWGWETPGSLLRGHFTGHWLSAAAREVAVTGDAHLRATLDDVVDGLRRCQDESDGEWAYAIPSSFLRRLELGRDVWAPQYTLHKTLMGLLDVYLDLGDERALEVARRAAQPLVRWARAIDPEQFQTVLEVETGGMLEVWADLLAATGDETYREMLELYYHRSVFDGLLQGVDVLTNRHANTTIPEVLGAARAYEVTGDERWRRVVEAYWDWAVTRRGTFCTGGQTSGEIWTPPFAFAARRGEKTQEHCSVYNMIRLADVLFRWTGEASYLDYIERNLINGILAQQNPITGMVAYFLPLEGGARKAWGSPTEDFWCCHGSLVQAHTRHSSLVFYRGEDESLTIAQHIAATARITTVAGEVSVGLERLDDAQDVGPDQNSGDAGETHRPHAVRLRVTVESAQGVPLQVRLRVPGWTEGPPVVAGEARVEVADGFLTFEHTGGRTSLEVAFGFAVHAVPIPDEPTTVAFVEGPVVLAGLVEGEVALYGDPGAAAELLVPDNERQWSAWLTRYRVTGQPTTVRLRPLHEVVDERYSVYFPIVEGEPA